MSAIADTEVAYEDMSATDILKQMKSMMKALEKKTKSSESKLNKLEEKEEKRASAAPAKGVRPVQLEKNNSWVEYVLDHMIHHGWESFVHKERFGKGMADVAMPESEHVPLPGADGQMVHVFKAVAPLAQPNLSHAMTVSAKYKSSKPELYTEWLDAWVEANPEEEKEMVVKEKPVVQRVSMTLAEKVAEKAKRDAEKADAAAEKKLLAAEKKAKTAAEKEKKKQDAAAAKALLAVNKSAKGGPKAAVLRAAVSGVKPALKPVAKPVVALKPATVAKPVDNWVPPPVDEFAPWKFKGLPFLRNALDVIFSVGPKGKLGEYVGIYDPATDAIDTSVKLEISDDEEDSSDSESDDE